MIPRKAHKSLIFVWITAISILISMLVVGNTYARNIDWDSSEYVYTPVTSSSYYSDCLCEGGQKIILADWQPDETQREITIMIGRPTLSVETTQPSVVTQTVPPVTETQPETLPEESTEVTVPEETVPEETTETVPTDIWPDDEILLLPDLNAEMYFSFDTVVEENEIRLIITRTSELPPEQSSTATVAACWNGLEATFAVKVLSENAGSEDVLTPEREIVTGLDLVNVFDTIRPDAPVTCVQLNLQTLSDFSLSFLQGDSSLKKVRWSIDGGQTYTMLYDSNVLTVNYPYPENWDGTVFLDFGLCLVSDERPTISINATGYLLEEYKPLPQPLPEPESYLVKISEMPAVLPMSGKWGAASAQILGVERLTADATGQLAYQSDASIAASMIRDGLVLEAAEESAEIQPGSYRLRIQWVWNGYVIEDQIVYFFVNTN